LLELQRRDAAQRARKQLPPPPRAAGLRSWLLPPLWLLLLQLARRQRLWAGLVVLLLLCRGRHNARLVWRARAAVELCSPSSATVRAAPAAAAAALHCVVVHCHHAPRRAVHTPRRSPRRCFSCVWLAGM
jgi:hypothetical protein